MAWAVVVGATEGLGAAFAGALGRRGLNLVVVACQRRRRLSVEAAAAADTSFAGLGLWHRPAEVGHLSQNAH